MSSLDLLITDFKAFYAETPWYGNSYLNVISDISLQVALATPPNGHSIAVMLWHMVKWRKALTERLLGTPDFKAADTDTDNWLEAKEQTEATWEAAKAAFAVQQTILIEHLAKQDEAFLDTEFVPGWQYRRLVSGVLQHDIYHLGQIAMVKNLIVNHGFLQ